MHAYPEFEKFLPISLHPLGWPVFLRIEHLFHPEGMHNTALNWLLYQVAFHLLWRGETASPEDLVQQQMQVSRLCLTCLINLSSSSFLLDFICFAQFKTQQILSIGTIDAHSSHMASQCWCTLFIAYQFIVIEIDLYPKLWLYFMDVLLHMMQALLTVYTPTDLAKSHNNNLVIFGDLASAMDD